MRRLRDQTSFGVAKHKFHLFACHAGEPLQEIVDPCATFQIFEQGPHRHPAMIK